MDNKVHTLVYVAKLCNAPFKERKIFFWFICITITVTRTKHLLPQYYKLFLKQTVINLLLL